MIKKPITFILGAGASNEFGFPLGTALIDRIIENLKVKGTPHYNELLKLEYPEGVINGFVSELANSGLLSIDTFLRNRQNYQTIGKLAIAQALLPFENTDNLFPRADVHWYRYLFSRMASNATHHSFRENQIAFISFNYDLSLEHFLFTALKNSNFGDTILNSFGILEFSIVFRKSEVFDKAIRLS